MGLTSDDLFGATAFERASRLLALAGAGLVLLGRDLEIVAVSGRAERMLGQHLAALNETPTSHTEAGEGFRERVLRAQQTGAEDAFACVGVLGSESQECCEVRCIPCGAGLALVVRDVTEHRGSGELRRAIVETAVSGIIVIDGAGQIQSVNAAAERLFGYVHDELLGCNVSMLMPESERSEHDANLSRYQAGGPPRIIGVGREVMARRKDGSEFPIHLAVGETLVAGQRMFTGIVSDLTERTRLEEDLQSAEVRTRVRAEHAALRRVATAVASGMDLGRICHLVAKEAAGHLGVDVGLVCRFDDGVGKIMGQWSSGARITDPALPLAGAGALAQLLQTGRPTRVDDYALLGDDPVADGVGHLFGASVAAPITSPQGIWGALLAATTRAEPFAPHAEDRLADFAELVGMAIANAADRARLVELGSPDPLTGLENRRTFLEHLAGEVKRATRHGYALALVVLDIDGFTQINERHGRPVGDQVLSGLARYLRSVAREDDLLARLGSDEFAWLLPYCDLEGAHQAAERVRHDIADHIAAGVGRVTVSIGICDLTRAHEAEHLRVYADTALYWAKRRGGNIVFQYESAAPEMPPTQRTALRMDPTHTLTSVYALARAVDVKDPSTREHSRRVAALAGQLATVLGWTQARVARLREAGLLYDVGKIGLPDAILLKSATLTPEEYEVAQTHAASGAQIIEGILSDEQVLWVRHHHERYDGCGYPDGLYGARIPEGARILAVADSWDAMTSARPYKVALSPEQAIEECRCQAGIQFCPDAVRALVQLWEAGALTQGTEGSVPSD